MTNHLEAEKVAEHRLEHVQLGEVRISVYDMAGELATMLRYGNEHAAKLVPVRVQSACAYGEVLGAADCDCKTQLDEAFKMFKDARCGILIYLNQEGRGAGLAARPSISSIWLGLARESTRVSSRRYLPPMDHPPVAPSPWFSTLRQDSVALVERLTAADLAQGGTHSKVGYLQIRDLLHEKDRLGQWMPTVPPP